MSKKILATARFLVLLIVATQCQYCAVDTEWHEENGYRWAKLAVPRSGKTGFKQLTESETGITFTNNLTKEQIKLQVIVDIRRIDTHGRLSSFRNDL